MAMFNFRIFKPYPQRLAEADNIRQQKSRQTDAQLNQSTAVTTVREVREATMQAPKTSTVEV